MLWYFTLMYFGFFFKISFFEKFFQEYHQIVNSLDPENIGSDLDPNCLQKLSACSCERVST